MNVGVWSRPAPIFRKPKMRSPSVPVLDGHLARAPTAKTAKRLNCHLGTPRAPSASGAPSNSRKQRVGLSGTAHHWPTPTRHNRRRNHRKGQLTLSEPGGYDGSCRHEGGGHPHDAFEIIQIFNEGSRWVEDAAMEDSAGSGRPADDGVAPDQRSPGSLARYWAIK